jgi:putative tryptophan/tyrosine transport system substrate-binding protein
MRKEKEMAIHIGRREFITLLGSAAATWPLVARAQQVGSPRRIGVLLVGLSPESKEAKHFRLGLRDAGYFEGRDVVIEWRSAKGDYNRVPELVAELVNSRVDVIVLDSTVATEVTKRSTSTIPIVMALVTDPVGSGLVKSLAHPGGNVTGLSVMTTELNSKRLQLLKEVTPQLTRAAVLWNPDHPFHSKVVEDLKVIAPLLSIELSSVGVRTPEQFDQAFSEVSRVQAQALYVVEDPIFFAHRVSLLKLASTARLPTIHELRRFPEAGALISYGPDLHDLFRRSAIYVDRILKGAKPADLPVEQPTKFELVINLKTAKALGLEVPPTWLALADEVIE